MNERKYFGLAINSNEERQELYSSILNKIFRHTPKDWCSDDKLSRLANIFIIKNIDKIYNLRHNENTGRHYVFISILNNEIDISLVSEDDLVSSVG